MPHDVFISYASQNKQVADAVCATLEARGIRCWVAPRDIIPGSDWAESIVDAIKWSTLMLLVFSEHANASNQVKKEVERAVHHGIPIIPLRIQDVVPNKSLEYFISTPHWLDAMTPPLERHLQQVAETVELLLARIKKNPDPAPRAATTAKKRSNAKAIALTAAAAVAVSGTVALYVILGRGNTAKPAIPPPSVVQGPVAPPSSPAPAVASATPATAPIANAVHTPAPAAALPAVTPAALSPTAPVPVVAPLVAAPTPVPQPVVPQPPAAAVAHYQNGSDAVARFDLDTAIDEFSQAINLYPKYAAAFAGRSYARSLQAEESQLKPAVDDGAQAIALDPNSAAGYASRGLALYSLNETHQANADLNRALQLDPKSIPAHVARCIGFLNTSDSEDAKAEADEVRSLDSDGTTAALVQAAVACDASDWNKALDQADRAIRANPDWWYPHCFRALALAGLGRLDDAQSEADTLIRLDPNAGLAQEARAMVLLDRGNSDDALAAVDKAVALRPAYGDAYAVRSLIRVEKSQMDLALADVQEALQHDPRSWALAIRGLIHLSKRETDAAFTDADAAVSDHPQNGATHFMRALVYEKRNDTAKAVEDFSAAIKLSPGNTFYLADRAALRISQQDYDGALQDLNTAMAIKPDITVAVARANVYGALKQFDKELAAANDALGIVPGNGPALYCKASAEDALNQDDAAIADLSKAIAHDPRNVLYLQARSTLYNKRGMTDLANADAAAAGQGAAGAPPAAANPFVGNAAPPPGDSATPVASTGYGTGSAAPAAQYQPPAPANAPAPAYPPAPAPNPAPTPAGNALSPSSFTYPPIGAPQQTVEGLAIRDVLDDHGRVTAQCYFDANGQPTPSASHLGAAELTWTFDDSGRITSITWRDASGSPIINTLGYSTAKANYDFLGRETDHFFDTFGRELRMVIEVTAVPPNSLGQLAGLRPGDIVISYNGRRVSSVAEVAQLVQAPGIWARPVVVVRNGQTVTLFARPGRLGIAATLAAAPNQNW